MRIALVDTFATVGKAVDITVVDPEALVVAGREHGLVILQLDRPDHAAQRVAYTDPPGTAVARAVSPDVSTGIDQGARDTQVPKHRAGAIDGQSLGQAAEVELHVAAAVRQRVVPDFDVAGRRCQRDQRLDLRCRRRRAADREFRGVETPRFDQLADRRVEPSARHFLEVLRGLDHRDDVRVGRGRLAARKRAIDVCQQTGFPWVPVAMHGLEQMLQFREGPARALHVSAGHGDVDQRAEHVIPGFMDVILAAAAREDQGQ